MKIKFEVKKIKEIRTDAVASIIFEDHVDTKLHWLNTLYKGSLNTLVDTGDFKGKTGDVHLVYVDSEAKAKRLILTGIGQSKEVTLDKLRKAFASAAKKFNSLKLKSAGFEIPDLTLIKGFLTNYSIDDIVTAICEGVFLSQYSFNKYHEENKFTPIEDIIFFTDSPKFQKEINEIVKETKIICDAVFVARDLGNEPSNNVTPNRFAEIVKKQSIKGMYDVTIFDEKKLKQLNMNCILGVGQASENPPRFMILQYFGSNKSDKPVVLVGKGVTFDSGGISLKPSPGMEAMKMDMGGAAAVVGTFEAIARLKFKINVIGLIPLAENMPGGNALKPGDVIKSFSGTSIEVANTDAEGRLILADALGYANNYKPRMVIDTATLTGAVLITFGHLLAGVMGNDKNIIKRLFDAGEKTNERVWELPLYDEYDKLMKSDIADIKNIGPPRLAGTIMGGIFLKKFVNDNYPWVHVDIAGTAIVPDASEYISKDATGYGVRLFVEFLRHLGSK